MIVSHTVKGVCRCCIVVSHTATTLCRCCTLISHTATTLCRCCIVTPHTVKGLRKRCMVISHTATTLCRCCTLISHTVKGPPSVAWSFHTLRRRHAGVAHSFHTLRRPAQRDERDLSGWLPNGFAAFGRSFKAGCISLSMHPLTDIQYEYTNSNHLSFDGRLHDRVGPARGAREVCVHL